MMLPKVLENEIYQYLTFYSKYRFKKMSKKMRNSKIMNLYNFECKYRSKLNNILSKKD